MHKCFMHTSHFIMKYLKVLVGSKFNKINNFYVFIKDICKLKWNWQFFIAKYLVKNIMLFAQSVQKTMQWKKQITLFYHENSWPTDSLKGSQGRWGSWRNTLWESLTQRKETNSGNGKIARSYKILYSILKTWTRLESNEKT